MISPNAIMRVARPTDQLAKVAQMYQSGLGFQILAEFYDHQGFDGVVLGHPQRPYHLEFTHHRGTQVGQAPSKDNLIVFYIPDKSEWEKACMAMVVAGFVETPSYNPYWDVVGQTFADVDGYRVVLQNREWSV